jgi:hypothetical protein
MISSPFGDVGDALEMNHQPSQTVTAQLFALIIHLIIQLACFALAIFSSNQVASFIQSWLDAQS